MADPDISRPLGWRITRQGWLWLLIVVVLLALGIGKNINLLVLLGFVLLTTFLLSFLVVGHRLTRLEARRCLPDHVFAGSFARLELRLRNLDRRRCVGICLEDAGSHHRNEWYFARIPGRARKSCLAELLLPRRGWYELLPLTVVSGYPFGLIRRRVRVGTGDRILVVPAIGKITRERLRQYLRGNDPHGERVQRRGWRHETAQADFHGLRPMRPGDSPRWIHWRTSARRGELMVREFEDVPGDDLVLVLDCSAISAEGFEAAVSLAATVVVEWCQRRGDRLVLLVTGPPAALLDGVSSPEHGRELLECLALAQMGAPGAGRLDLSSEQVPRTAALLVVSAGDSELPDLLERQVYRRVTHLDARKRHEWGFYTPPS